MVVVGDAVNNVSSQLRVSRLAGFGARRGSISSNETLQSKCERVRVCTASLEVGEWKSSDHTLDRDSRMVLCNRLILITSVVLLLCGLTSNPSYDCICWLAVGRIARPSDELTYEYLITYLTSTDIHNFALRSNSLEPSLDGGLLDLSSSWHDCRGSDEDGIYGSRSSYLCSTELTCGYRSEIHVFHSCQSPSLDARWAKSFP